MGTPGPHHCNLQSVPRVKISGYDHDPLVIISHFSHTGGGRPNISINQSAMFFS